MARYALQFVCDTGVARGTQKLFLIRWTNDPCKLRLVRGDPICWRQCADGPNTVFVHDKLEHDSEEALKKVEEVTDGPHSAPHHDEREVVENHFPVDASIRREESGSKQLKRHDWYCCRRW